MTVLYLAAWHFGSIQTNWLMMPSDFPLSSAHPWTLPTLPSIIGPLAAGLLQHTGLASSVHEELCLLPGLTPACHCTQQAYLPVKQQTSSFHPKS